LTELLIDLMIYQSIASLFSAL